MTLWDELATARRDLHELEMVWERIAPDLPLNAVLAVSVTCNAIAAVRRRLARLEDKLKEPEVVA